MIPLWVPILGIAGYLWYVSRRSRERSPDSLDHAITDTVAPPTNLLPATMPPMTTTVAPQPDGMFTGESVMCPPTATERSPVSCALVEPRVQPKTQSAEKQAEASALAPQLDAALKSNPHGPDYAANPKKATAAKDQALVELVKRFQAATGLVADGLYGPATAGALMFYLKGQPPPPPFFYAGQRVIKIFRPRP